LGGHDLRPDPRSQQGSRIGRTEHIQRNVVSSGRRGQTAKARPARHDRHRSRRTRQQRLDVLEVAGIVEKHEHPFAGQNRPELRGPGIQRRGDLIGGHPQRGDESSQHHRRSQRRRIVEAPQIDVQLTVGEPLRDLMSPVQRERRLSDPSSP